MSKASKVFQFRVDEIMAAPQFSPVTFFSGIMNTRENADVIGTRNSVPVRVPAIVHDY